MADGVADGVVGAAAAAVGVNDAVICEQNRTQWQEET